MDGMKSAFKLLVSVTYIMSIVDRLSVTAVSTTSGYNPEKEWERYENFGLG
jgi:hypothetical protein